MNTKQKEAESLVLSTPIGDFAINFNGENHVYFKSDSLVINRVLCRGSYHLYLKDKEWVCCEALKNPNNNTHYYKMQSAYLSRNDKFENPSIACQKKFFQTIEDSFKEWRENNPELLRQELSRAYVQYWTDQEGRVKHDIQQLKNEIKNKEEELAEIERKFD